MFFVKKKKIPWQQIVAGPAAENPFAQKYHVEGIPATFLIDGQGKVVAKQECVDTGDCQGLVEPGLCFSGECECCLPEPPLEPAPSLEPVPLPTILYGCPPSYQCLIAHGECVSRGSCAGDYVLPGACRGDGCECCVSYDNDNNDNDNGENTPDPDPSLPTPTQLPSGSEPAQDPSSPSDPVPSSDPYGNGDDDLGDKCCKDPVGQELCPHVNNKVGSFIFSVSIAIGFGFGVIVAATRFV